MTLNIKSSRVFTAKVTHKEISNTIIHLLGHTEIWTVGISRGNKDIEGLHLDSLKNHKYLKLAYMSKKEEGFSSCIHEQTLFTKWAWGSPPKNISTGVLSPLITSPTQPKTEVACFLFPFF